MDEYRLGDITRFPVGDRFEIVYSKDAGRTFLYSKVAASLMNHCRSFKTLEQHVTALQHQPAFHRETAQSLREQLLNLLNDGLLISKNKALKKCEALGAAHEAGSMTTVCLPTRNRIKSLQRCMSSFIQNIHRYGRKAGFVVSDGAEDAGARRECRAMLKELRRQHKVEILYAGLEEKERFVQALAAQGIPPDVVRFALFDTENTGYSPGANRNALLLSSAGKLILMTDDDTVCRLTDAPGSESTLTLVSGRDPTEFCFFPDAGTMMNSVPFLEEDVLGHHEELLGRELGGCIQRNLSLCRINLDYSSPSFLRNVLDCQGAVLATQTGIIGDLGSASPSGYLALEGKSRDRLLRSQSEYRRTIVNRLVLRKANFPTVTDGAFCMTTSIGLDLRRLLPPFVPVYRNSDGVFGASLRACHPGGFIAHLPRAVAHLPLEEVRAFEPDNVWDTSVDFGFDEIVMESLKLFHFESTRRDAAGLFRTLGRNLTELGSLDVSAFAEALILRMIRRRQSYADYLEKLLVKYGGQPDYWAQDVKKRLEKIQTELIHGQDTRVPARQDPEADAMKAWKARRSLVLKFGQLLQIWPDMVAASNALHEREQGMSERP